MADTLTADERATMLGLLKYPTPIAIHPDEARWRDFSRTELSLRDERICALERINASLAAEVDRMRPVVQAAQGLVHLDVLFHAGELSKVSLALDKAIAAYEAAQEQG